MNLKEKMIMQEYRDNRDDFKELGNIVSDFLRTTLKENNIAPLAVEHRVKQEESLAGKLELKGDKYSCLADITDILGVRVILFFSDEIDRVAQIIRDKYAVDWDNSVDKRAVIDANTFGYMSLHYICYLPSDSGYPENLCNRKFEVQIRTTLQHTWAVINHDLGYKSAFGLPRDVIRRFSMLSSLLELADEQFVQARDDIKFYENSVKEKIANDTADDLRIDTISLDEFMKHNKGMTDFLGNLSDVANGAEINHISPEPYVSQLAFLHITKIGKLSEMLKRDRDLALTLAKASLENTDLDILSSNVSLRFLCRAELIMGDYDRDEIIQFLEISMNNNVRAARTADKLLRYKRTLKYE